MPYLRLDMKNSECMYKAEVPHGMRKWWGVYGVGFSGSPPVYQ
jgi:hypothetical protein